MTITEWIGFGIICLLIIFLLLRKGFKDALQDEHSPENLKFNQALKASRLRQKLKNIEEERKKEGLL
jgi:hypothetical protein